MVYRSQIKFKRRKCSSGRCPLTNWFAKESLKINKLYLFRRNGSTARIKDGENKLKSKRKQFKGRWLYGGTRELDHEYIARIGLYNVSEDFWTDKME